MTTPHPFITPASTPEDGESPITERQDLPNEFEQLTSDEVQELRRIMESNRQDRARSFKVPELPIEEGDKDRFAECLVQGKAFEESFDRFKGKLKVTFRSRFKWEEDAIIEQIFKDFTDKVIKSDGQYANRLNLYNLSCQTKSLDGVAQAPIKKADDLRLRVDNGIFEKMPEPKLYILTSLLSQFDTKVTTLCHLALPDFSKPDADS